MDLPIDYATSYFLSGLKLEIQLTIRMFMPKNVQHAIILSKIEEAKMLIHQKGKVLSKSFMNYSDHTSTSQFHANPSGHNFKPLLPLPTFPALPSNER